MCTIMECCFSGCANLLHFFYKKTGARHWYGSYANYMYTLT